MLQAQQAPRNGALDGLRLLSIVAVILYHLNLQVLPSGHMGVVVFLVLSGYLATNTIVRHFDEEGTVHLGYLLRSWVRRFARIWPSVVALVAIVATLCGTLNAVLLTKMRPDLVPSLGFFLNWSYIIRDVSYFDMIGGSSPLLHLWYLGCDMQFFLAWTLVLSLVLRAGKRFARFLAFVGALASAAWMAWLFVPNGDPSRIYYGTDTRAFSLLLGSWLALAFPLGKQPEICKGLLVKDIGVGNYGTGKTRATFFAHLFGLASLGGIIAMMLLIPSDSAIWYRGGMLGFSALTTLLVATLLAPTTITGFILGLAPFRVLGQRAFALYLWHYPIFMLMEADKSTTVWWMRLLAVGVSIVAAELSLRFFERPFSISGAAKKETEDHEQKAGETAEGTTPAEGAKKRHALKPVAILRIFSITAIVSCGCYSAYLLGVTPDAFLVPLESMVSTGAAADSAMDLSQHRPSGSNVNPSSPTIPPASSANGSDASTVEAEKTKEPVTVTDLTILSAPASEVDAGMYDPLLIGDSVPGDAGNDFVANGGGWEGRLPNSLIDTYIGRNPNQSLEVLRGYLQQNVVGKIVVMACFSNSTPFPDTLDAMIEAIGSDRILYLVGTVNPDGFQDAANANLQAAAEAHENVHYVDWPAVLEGHMDEYLWADNTHLRPEGARVYVDMVVRAIAQDMVDAGGVASEPE